MNFPKNILSATTTLKNSPDLRIFMDQKFKCPECGSQKIKMKIGENVCKKCGFVIEDGIVVSC